MDFLRRTVGNTLDLLNPRNTTTDSYYLAHAAYDPKKYDKELSKRGYTRDPELSNEDAQVYTKDGKGYVAYRGTSKLKDLAPDLDILRGKRKHRDFDGAVEMAKRVRDKYGNAKAVGHSLGGTKAIHAARVLDITAEVYNPGSSALYPERIDDDDIVVHKNPLDIISSGVHGKSVKWWRNPFSSSSHRL